MAEKPFQINDVLPAMTTEYDIDQLAAKLAPRIKGVINEDVDLGEARLRGITWAPYREDDTGHLVITDHADGLNFGEQRCVYAMYMNDELLVHGHMPLAACEDSTTAERLASALRTLVYGRERLAGRMRGRDDHDADTQTKGSHAQ